MVNVFGQSLESIPSRPRILVVGVDWLGDVIFSTPVLRALRNQFPKGFLAYSAPASVIEILRENPHLDLLIPYDEGAFFLSWIENLRFLRSLRRHAFDWIFFLHRSATRSFLGVLSGAGRRVGIPTRKRRWFLTDPVPPVKEPVHRVDRYLWPLEWLGISPCGREVEVFVSEEERQGIHTLFKGTALEDDAPFAVIHPGANWDLKRWPPDYFKEMLRFLNERGLFGVLCGTQKERDLCAEILKDLPDRKKAFSLCGKTSLRELCALIHESRLVLSNDSGPLHIAAGLGVPLVGLYGPTSAQITGPISRGPVCLIENRVGCEVPCTFQACHHRVCMEALEPDRVCRALDGFLVEAGCLP